MGTLSGGELQMLAVGRVLMVNSKILMMDEASLGLASILVKKIFNIIKILYEQGNTMSVFVVSKLIIRKDN